MTLVAWQQLCTGSVPIPTIAHFHPGSPSDLWQKTRGTIQAYWQSGADLSINLRDYHLRYSHYVLPRKGKYQRQYQAKLQNNDNVYDYAMWKISM